MCWCGAFVEARNTSCEDKVQVRRLEVSGMLNAFTIYMDVDGR